MRSVAAKFFVFAAISGLVALGSGGRQLWILATWPTVVGRVVGSRIGSYESTGRGSSRTMYRAEFDVAYELEGAPHRGTAASSFWSHDVNEAETVQSSFRVGTSHAFWLNPSKTGELLFDLGGFGGFSLPVLAGLSALVTFVVALVLRRLSTTRA